MIRTILQSLSAVLMLFLGIYIIVSPADFLAVVTVVFALYLVFDGLRSLVSAARFRHLPSRIVIPVLVKGAVNTLLGLLLAILAWRSRKDLPHVLVYLIAFDFLFTAIADLVSYVFLKRDGEEAGSLGVEAVFSLILALLLAIFPGVSASLFFTLAGAVVFASGVLLLYMQVNAFIVRKRFKERQQGVSQGPADIYDD